MFLGEALFSTPMCDGPVYEFSENINSGLNALLIFSKPVQSAGLMAVELHVFKYVTPGWWVQDSSYPSYLVFFCPLL